jgi:hypothetical protein
MGDYNAKRREDKGFQRKMKGISGGGGSGIKGSQISKIKHQKGFTEKVSKFHKKAQICLEWLNEGLYNFG